jgi:hypothetical protein
MRAAPKGLREWSDHHPATRRIQDGEVYEPEDSGEIAGERCLKLRGDISRFVFEHTTSPGA